MPLILLYFISLISAPNIEILVAKGSQKEAPKTYTAIEELNRLEIKQSYWAKVEISDLENKPYILQGGKANLNRIVFFDSKMNSLGTGNHIRIQPKESTATYYLFYDFVDEKDRNLLSISLKKEIDFVKNTHQDRIFQIAFHSFLAFPLFISLILAWRTKAIVYVYYSLYIASMMAFFGYQYGLAGELIAVVNQIPPIWIWFFGFLQTTFYLLFTSSFLNLPKYDPFSQKLLNIGHVFIVTFFLISISLHMLVIDVQKSIAYKAPFWAFETILIVWFVARTFRHPSTIKFYYLTGFMVLVIVSISGQILSTSQSATEYNHLFQIGLVAEVFILALGLSARVSEIQRQESKTQNELINQLKVNEELQVKYTTELEAQVQQRTEALSKRNEDNEMLLKEVHHRVKNNLQMITSMLNMSERRSTSKEVSAQLISTRNKIKSMALIHEHLYLTSDFSSVDLKEYISRLCEMIIKSLYRGKKIDLKLDIDDISADIETAISLGLIINELITNSIKYGLKDNEKSLLKVRLFENEGLYLAVSDSGTGFANVNKNGLGLTIIQSILENMGGTIHRNHQGGLFVTEIKMKDYSLNK